MMAPAVELRLAHAEQHLDLLDELAAAWLANEAGDVFQEFDPERSRISVRLSGTLPPLTLSLVFGDVIHALRASLDNALYVAVTDAGGRWRSGPGGHQFPIREYDGKEPREAVTRLTKGVTPKQLAVIEEAQPYHWGENSRYHLLARLNAAANLDKHTLLQPGYAAAQSAVLTGPLAGTALNAGAFNLGEGVKVDMPIFHPLRDCELGRWSVVPEDRAELAWIEVVPTGPDPQVQVYPEVTPQITWGDWPGQIGQQMLRDILGYVRHLLGAL